MQKMRKLLDSWRWYTLGQDQYLEYIKKMYKHNLYNLRRANTVIVVLSICWSIFPLAIEKDLGKAGIYFITTFIAIILVALSNLKLKQLRRENDENNLFLYSLTTIYYTNIMMFGIFLGVWSNPDKFAVTFMSFLICALFLFIYPPVYNLSLTMGATAVFVISSYLVKPYEIWVFDCSNVLIAGCLGLFFGWHITKLRLVSALNTGKMEEERNKYYNQSQMDELTGLRNRRDFMQTFQRYLSTYRSYDDWLCIAIADIDFFKNFNDHYGHPKGDECLRSIGSLLNGLKDSMNVYTARVGGEEFALLWFEKEKKHASTVVSQINGMISDLKIHHEKSEASSFVTLSMGIYIVRCGTINDLDVLYNLADKALYTAKNNGRNCTYVSGTDIEQYKITPGI